MVAAETYLTDHWRGAGWQVFSQDYLVDDRLWQQAGNLNIDQRRRLLGSVGRNWIAYRPGSTEKVTVVAAHLDTLTQTPGADDNTSGIAALIELGHMLGPLGPSVALVAFDMEEWHLLGSSAFAARPPWPVAAAIVYECIGYFVDPPHTQAMPAELRYLFPQLWKNLTARQFRGDFCLLVHRAPGAGLARRLQKAFQEMDCLIMRDPADLPLLGKILAGRFPVLHNLQRSDHAPFWDLGIPALMVTDTAEFRNANYHRPSDLPDTLDYERMARVVEATARYLQSL